MAGLAAHQDTACFHSFGLNRHLGRSFLALLPNPGRCSISKAKGVHFRFLALDITPSAGRAEIFVLAMGVYALANACIGATPAAYAADVMQRSDASGFGLGIYRCAGDVGM